MMPFTACSHQLYWLNLLAVLCLKVSETELRHSVNLVSESVSAGHITLYKILPDIQQIAGNLYSVTGRSMLTFLIGQNKVNTSSCKNIHILVSVVANGCFLTFVLCQYYLLWLQYARYSQNGHTFTKCCMHKDVQIYSRLLSSLIHYTYIIVFTPIHDSAWNQSRLQEQTNNQCCQHLPDSRLFSLKISSE